MWPGTDLCAGYPTIYDRPTLVAVTTPRDVAPDRVLRGWWTDGANVASLEGSVVQISPPGNRGIGYLERLDQAPWPPGRYEFHVVAGESSRVDDRLPDAARLTNPSGRAPAPGPGTAAPLGPSPAHDRPHFGRHHQTKADSMTSTQTLRTLGAATLGAVVVAIAALSVRTGPVSGAPASDTPATHTITVSATGKITVVPDVARLNLGVTATKSTVKAAREAGAKAMTDIIAALKALGIADADIQTTNLSLYPQYGTRPDPEGRRLPDQRAAPGHRPRHRQGR